MKEFEIEKISDKLKKSPIFNLSLGSKELFHSNFIDWLAKNYPQESAKIFARFIKDQSGDISIVKTYRELNHTDVHFFFANGQELIIENKMKSLPNQQQLDRYSKNPLPNQNFLLLTLIQPCNIKRDGLWRVITYAKLADSMINSYLKIANTYHKEIIRDYINVISSLGKIFSSIDINTDNKFNFYSIETDSIFACLDSLRMGGVYQKIKYQILAGMIYKRLSKSFPKETFFYNEHEVAIKECSQGSFYIWEGFTRNQGLLDVVFVIRKGLFLTIQIQGNQYRQMVQGYSGYGSGSKDIAHRLREQKLWFIFSHIHKNKKFEEYPRGDKVFNKYSDVDFYRSAVLRPEFTVSQVISFVIEDTRRIIKNRDKIYKLI